jgi:3-phenylpropionate/trans-cinnamate dioxygenase ferredoxin component
MIASFRVASVGEIPEGKAKRVEVDGEEIAVVHARGYFYAINDICSHEYFHLSDGEVDADELTIECPKHGSVFSLETGEPKSLPAVLPVRTYGVRVEGDDVIVELFEAAEEAAAAGA